jgi:hypothetical protein
LRGALLAVFLYGCSVSSKPFLYLPASLSILSALSAHILSIET